MSFAAIAFLDTFELAGSLRTRLGEFPPSPPLVRKLVVRAPRNGAAPDSEDFAWRPVLYRAKKSVWPELWSLLARIRREGDRVFGGVEFGHVWLELLDRGAVQQWATEAGEYAERYTRLHLALRTNPQAMMFSGTAAMHLLPGALTAVDVRVPYAALNLGDVGRVHLVIELKKKESAE